MSLTQFLVLIGSIVAIAIMRKIDNSEPKGKSNNNVLIDDDDVLYNPTNMQTDTVSIGYTGVRIGSMDTEIRNL